MKPGLARAVLSGLRWSFTPPWNWLSGVAFNLGLSLAYLVIVPLTGRPHRDWAILVGTYFAVFILADVTTTNVLGADHLRVRRSLDRRTSLARILLIKNITLMLLVGVPTLIATAAITVHSESAYRLDLTLPGVLYPVLTWLGWATWCRSRSRSPHGRCASAGTDAASSAARSGGWSRSVCPTRCAWRSTR